MSVDSQESEQAIQSIILARNAKQRSLMQKTIVRLIVFGDEDLRLMPIYFERLKQWCQLRRLYKWHIMKSE